MRSAAAVSAFVFLVVTSFVHAQKPQLVVKTDHIKEVNSVAFSPDGHTLALGGDDLTIKLWDIASGRELRTLAGHTGTVRSVAFSPDGKMLASGSLDKTIKLWDASTWQAIRSLEGHKNEVMSVAFSPDGRTLASGSWDKTIKLWDVATGRKLRTLTGHTREVTSVAFSPDGKILASAGDETKLWEVATGRELLNLTDAISVVAFSPDGRTLASGGRNYTVRLWDVASGHELHSLALAYYQADAIAFSPDGQTLASGGMTYGIMLWDVASGREIRTLYGHIDWVKSLAFSTDGRFLASSSYSIGQGREDVWVGIRNAASGEELATLFALDQNDWAVVDPQGRFDASPGGMHLMRWVQGDKQIDLAQLKDRYYEPGLLQKVLGFNKEPLRDVTAFADASTIGSSHLQADAVASSTTSSVNEVPASEAPSANLAKEPSRGFEVEANAPPAAVLSAGPAYALVIGINKYSYLPQLATAEDDAAAVASVLERSFGFHTKVLLNATRHAILTALSDYSDALPENANLLIYFAGHGYFDKAGNKAYWLPVDAERNSRADWIIADDITTAIRIMPARHVLIISDSCYSGGLTRDVGLTFNSQDRNRYLAKMNVGRSRTLLASGGIEPVSDSGGRSGHSVFASALLDGLNKMENDTFTAEELFASYVLRQVAGNSDQAPQYSFIRDSGDEAGDFVFVRRSPN